MAIKSIVVAVFYLAEKEQARTDNSMGAESLIMIHFISVAAPEQAFMYNTALGECMKGGGIK